MGAEQKTRFVVDKSKCIQCGRCEYCLAVCPVGAISIFD